MNSTDSTDSEQKQVFSLTDKAVRHVLRTLEKEGRSGHGLRVSCLLYTSDAADE